MIAADFRFDYYFHSDYVMNTTAGLMWGPWMLCNGPSPGLTYEREGDESSALSPLKG